MKNKIYTFMNTPITVGLYTKLCVICAGIYMLFTGIYLVFLYINEIREWFESVKSKIKNFFGRFKRSKNEG